MTIYSAVIVDLYPTALINPSPPFCFIPNLPSSSQIKNESFLEDINNILNSGDVPNLYAVDEQDQIMAAMKPIVQDLGQQPTKSNLLAAYIKRVRSNIHTVLCMR